MTIFATPRASRLVLAFLALSLTCAAAVPLACQTPTEARYLDTAPDKEGAVRLAVFNPEIFNIRALADLRRRGKHGSPWCRLRRE